VPFPADTRSPWPPKAYAAGYDALREASVWYEGSPAALGRFYATTYRKTTRLLGGFWQRTTETLVPAARQRLHLPAAADLAKASADMLVGEAPTLRIPSAHVENATAEAKATQARLDELYTANGGVTRLHEALEITAALGGGYSQVTWDRGIADYPLWSVVHADAAVPVFRWGLLVEVVFWRQVGDPADAQKVLRHLELHERGRVTHRLYLGTPEAIGRTVPLADDDATRPLADLARDTANRASPDPGDANGVTVETPFADGLDVRYIPNVRPARRLRSDVTAGAWGRSDYEGLEPFMDSLDEVYTSAIRDIRLAKARLVVPHEYLSHGGPGKGQAFDADAEIFSPLEIPPGSGDAPAITEFQAAIRAEDHIRMAREYYAQTVNMAGYAPQSFGMEIEGPAESGTARRIKERKSVATTGMKQGYAESPIEETMELLLVADREIFGNMAVTPERASVTWGDTFASDPTEIAQTVALLATAEAVSRETRVKMVHPDWTDAEVKAEVDRLTEENKPPELPDPFGDGDGGGGEGG
jgi:hypothetical protein